MMSLWDALRMNMMISYQELVRTFLKETKRSAQDNIQGWKDANAGKPGKPGGELGYNASKARKYAIEQMIARNEARRLAQSRESAVKKFNS
ncbi:hypothetical protein BA908_22260 [Klebsiella pneumoniae]|nr:hypothetical protein BA908_22260 [Klebsiella pneumoniae]